MHERRNRSRPILDIRITQDRIVIDARKPSRRSIMVVILVFLVLVITVIAVVQPKLSSQSLETLLMIIKAGLGLLHMNYRLT